MPVRLLVIAFLLGACHHDTPPVTPGGSERPPLPPSSGTPIGYLLDDTDLHLRDDQRTRLHEIDATLAAELEVLEARERSARPASTTGSQDDPPPSGMGHGRRGGGGRRGGRGGGGSRPPSGPTPNGAPKPDAGAVAQERAGDVREAVHRALAILDADQLKLAQKLLVDHDIDADTGGGPAKPRTTEPAEPAEAGEP
ncbi:MAG: hypothetical protein JWO36_2781 [Myxococcales bacterium]|nr:hypothetical protein [Myxococcales bacterium]